MISIVPKQDIRKKDLCKNTYLNMYNSFLTKYVFSNRDTSIFIIEQKNSKIKDTKVGLYNSLFIIYLFLFCKLKTTGSCHEILLERI